MHSRIPPLLAEQAVPRKGSRIWFRCCCKLILVEARCARFTAAFLWQYKLNDCVWCKILPKWRDIGSSFKMLEDSLLYLFVTRLFKKRIKTEHDTCRTVQRTYVYRIARWPPCQPWVQQCTVYFEEHPLFIGFLSPGGTSELPESFPFLCSHTSVLNSLWFSPPFTVCAELQSNTLNPVIHFFCLYTTVTTWCLLCHLCLK